MPVEDDDGAAIFWGHLGDVYECLVLVGSGCLRAGAKIKKKRGHQLCAVGHQ